MVLPQDVISLLEQLAEEARASLNYHGFGIMSDHILKETGEEISQRYLYENLWTRAQRALQEGEPHLRVLRERLDLIARLLKHRNFLDFSTQQAYLRLDSPLKTCLGNWYSYVRCNSGADIVLRSPVAIYSKEGQIYMDLHGPDRVFSGQLHFMATCIHSLLTSGDKSIHLIFKLGLSQNPQVLQGVFSGVSTSESPIAGREILVRQPESELSALTNKKLYLDDPEETELHPNIKHYFQHYPGNYIKINKVGTFGLDDLL